MTHIHKAIKAYDTNPQFLITTNGKTMEVKMIKLFFIIVFCVFSVPALSQEAEQVAPKVNDVDSEVTAAVEEVELSEEQKNYNFCVMQGTHQSVQLVGMCVNQAVQQFVQEHGQEKLQDTLIEDVAASCFHVGVQILTDLSEACKTVSESTEAAPAEAAPTETAPAEQKTNTQ